MKWCVLAKIAKVRDCSEQGDSYRLSIQVGDSIERLAKTQEDWRVYPPVEYKTIKDVVESVLASAASSADYDSDVRIKFHDPTTEVDIFIYNNKVRHYDYVEITTEEKQGFVKKFKDILDA